MTRPSAGICTLRARLCGEKPMLLGSTRKLDVFVSMSVLGPFFMTYLICFIIFQSVVATPPEAPIEPHAGPRHLQEDAGVLTTCLFSHHAVIPVCRATVSKNNVRNLFIACLTLLSYTVPAAAVISARIYPRVEVHTDLLVPPTSFACSRRAITTHYPRTSPSPSSFSPWFRSMYTATQSVCSPSSTPRRNPPPLPHQRRRHRPRFILRRATTHRHRPSYRNAAFGLIRLRLGARTPSPPRALTPVVE